MVYLFVAWILVGVVLSIAFLVGVGCLVIWAINEIMAEAVGKGLGW